MKPYAFTKLLVLTAPLFLCQCERFPDQDYDEVHVGLHIECPPVADSLKITVRSDEDVVLQYIGTGELNPVFAGNRLESEYELEIEFFCDDQWQRGTPYRIEVKSGVTSIYLTTRPDGISLFDNLSTGKCNELSNYKIIEKNS